MRRRDTWILLISVAAVLPAARADAYMQFWQVFDTEFLDKNEHKEWVEAVRDPKARVNCYICHQGKFRKNHNAFGEPLTELLDKKDYRALLLIRRNPEAAAETKKKVIASIEKVLKMPVDAKKPDGETFGDRLKAGKWPGGELEEILKEPPEEEENRSQESGVGSQDAQVAE